MKERVENALNESRILVLVAEVIVGFQYQAVFQRGYDSLSRPAQVAIVVGRPPDHIPSGYDWPANI